MSTPKRNAWTWIPSLYFAEGLPYVLVMTVSVIMYKNLELSNTEIALYTSWLYLPWVIKPLWSPIVDLLKTKRWWIVSMELVLGAALAGVALSLQTEFFFQYSLAFFWLIAFSSATHDISIDGFYMIALSEKEQSFFVGIRSTFYRIAMITGQGLIVILAGLFEEHLSDIKFAWTITFFIIAAAFLLLFIYHTLIIPKPQNDRAVKYSENFLKSFTETFISFFRKENIVVILLFILFYRFGEGQLVKLAAPFLLDNFEAGGLELNTASVGFIYGTAGVIALVLGGILGGIVASKHGLKYWFWWMLIAINLPNVVYIFLAFLQPQNFILIVSFVFIEQFGYGFGFTAFMLYLIYVSEGDHKTSHFAIATGLMALGMMIPGMISGWIQEMIGYKLFFVWILISTIPAFIISYFIKLDPEFGKKS